MRLLSKLRFFGKRVESGSALVSDHLPSSPQSDFTLVRGLSWISAGAGALGLGLLLGRELRRRYKFHRRTPYDLYAHAGDRITDVEFGVGV